MNERMEGEGELGRGDGLVEACGPHTARARRTNHLRRALMPLMPRGSKPVQAVKCWKLAIVK